jgi:hypothetical protein
MKSSFSSDSHHERFEELAALAAVAELSPLELERLQNHLAECPACRKTCAAFADVASNDLGVAVAGRQSTEDVDLGDEMNPRKHLAQFRIRLKTEASRLNAVSKQTREDVGADNGGGNSYDRSQTYGRVVCGIAAAILLTGSIASGIAVWRAAKNVSAERVRSLELQSVVDSLKRDKSPERAAPDNAVVRSLEESQRARDILQKSLSASEAKNDELLAREKASQEMLAGAIATVEQLRQQVVANNGDRERLSKLQQESDAKLREALGELYEARQASAQFAIKDESRQDASLEANAQPASPNEVEARNLFGARDLHIVDVYDVTGDGKTKRTYGRVYYVEKKLLVFYAFDLQDQQNHNRVVFQAWGYREANVGKPFDLGVFTIDDSPTSRWVLTVNRADVLSHIDAVFVTIEPAGGSATPRGKKVLYANLVGPPNHP